MKYTYKKLSGFLWCLLFGIQPLPAQDTLHLSLPDAEKQFIEKNLLLLAEQYNIGMARAQVIQARLYSNPNLSFTGNIYNPKDKKIIDISDRTGEYVVAAQQLVRLAGKRNKEIRLAETAVSISENRFFDLLRTLRFSLRSNFFSVYYLQQSVSAYQVPIGWLQKLSGAYDELKQKGVVTLKDATRIKSLLYTLKAEQSSLQRQLNDLESELQLLLGNNQGYFIAQWQEDKYLQDALGQWSLSSLVDTAYTNRFDLKLADNNLLYNQQNLALQRALARPDLLLGVQFDKRGSFVDNATFFSVAMDLPFFHRNQGNIRSAQLGIDQSKLLLNRQRAVIENEVQNAYLKCINTAKMLQSIDPLFRNDYEALLQGVTDNFQKKNISLIEFTDFYESYKDYILQFNRLQLDRAQAIEALNFATGKTIIH